MKKIILICSLFQAVLVLSAQNTTSRITVTHGASLDIYFNHLSDYSSGIILSDYTKMEIYFNETDMGGLGIGDGWQLSIEPDGNIQSVFSTSSIPINVIDIEVYDEQNDITSNYTLNNGETIIATGTQNVGFTNNITISYNIGGNNPIDIVSNERFVLLLKFTLKPKP